MIFTFLLLQLVLYNVQGKHLLIKTVDKVDESLPEEESPDQEHGDYTGVSGINHALDILHDKKHGGENVPISDQEDGDGVWTTLMKKTIETPFEGPVKVLAGGKFPAVMKNVKIELLAGAEKLTPVTANLSSTLVSSFGHNYTASVCIDGVTKVQHFKFAPQICKSKKELAPWLALDYGNGSKVSVEKVFLFNRKDFGFAKTKNVQIRISNKLPANGKAIFTGGVVLGTFKGPATRGQTVEIHSGPGWEKKTGRYLIIQMDMGKRENVLNLIEAYAFGISHEAHSNENAKQPNKGPRMPWLN